jgi:lipopolysaccharide transport system ATP-binding protein
MESVRRLCHRAIWISEGLVKADGPVDEIAQAYLASLAESPCFLENRDFGLAVERVTLKNSQGRETRQFSPGEDLTVEIFFRTEKPVEKPYVLLVVKGMNGNCFTANMLLDGHRPHLLEGAGCIRCTFKAIPLLPQNYTIKMAIRAKDGQDPIIDYNDVASFTVTADLANYGYKGNFQALASVSTPVVVPYEWRLPDGTIASVDLKGSW